MKRYYLDTSVWGGYFDTGFSEATRLLFEQAVAGKVKFVYSNLTIDELKNAPEQVYNLLSDHSLLPEMCREQIVTDGRSYRLASAYVEAGAITPGYFTDAEHIALAAIHAVDVIVSWNFKHMTNLTRIERYNEINRRFGYPMIDIRDPRQLV